MLKAIGSKTSEEIQSRDRWEYDRSRRRPLAAVSARAQISITTATTKTTDSVTIAPEKPTNIRQQLGTAALVTIKHRVKVGATVPDTMEPRSVLKPLSQVFRL